jgi:hypothetical protein
MRKKKLEVKQDVKLVDPQNLEVGHPSFLGCPINGQEKG